MRVKKIICISQSQRDFLAARALLSVVKKFVVVIWFGIGSEKISKRDEVKNSFKVRESFENLKNKLKNSVSTFNLIPCQVSSINHFWKLRIRAKNHKTATHFAYQVNLSRLKRGKSFHWEKLFSISTEATCGIANNLEAELMKEKSLIARGERGAEMLGKTLCNFSLWSLSHIHHRSFARHKHFNQIELILKSALTKKKTELDFLFLILIEFKRCTLRSSPSRFRFLSWEWKTQIAGCFSAFICSPWASTALLIAPAMEI